MADEEQQPLIGLQKKLQEKKHTRKLRRLKYSCEEVYERMDNGLCLFCDELDTPGHHDLKHKRIQIFLVEDDLASDDIEEFYQTQETVTNPGPIVETAKNLDSFIEPLVHDSVSQALDSVPDLLMVHKVEELPQKSASGSGKKIAHQLFDQMPNEYQKDLTVIESSNKEVLSSHKDSRVWEPGGLPTKMDHWDWFEKELKPYGESHKAAMFLYSQMQVVKSNPAESKTFDRKRSNKTLPLADEQDDEYEQNQVLKLISSWNNRIWEPGGVLIELDKWNWLEKCYNHGILMRLMHWLSNMNPHLASHVKQFDVSTVAYVAWLAKLFESSLLHTPAIQPRAPFSPYQNQNNQFHYNSPNTTSLLPPLETTKTLPYKPNFPTETNMEKSPRKLYCEEIQESGMRGLCMSSDGSYASGHHLGSKKAQVFVVEGDDEEPFGVREPSEVTVEEIVDKSVDMIQEEKSTPENESRPEVSPQILLSQFQVSLSSLEPGRRYQKESLVVVNDLSSNLGCVIGKTIGCNCDSEIGQDNSLDEEEFNRVWEPGGVFIEHDKWQGSEKCHELSIVVRLMQGLSSTRWSYGKVAELTQELQQPKTYLKEIKLKELERSVTCSSVGCIVALLMVYDAKRIQSDAPPIFSDLLCVKNRIQGRLKMVLLQEFLWLILFSSKMFKSSYVPQNKNQTNQKLSSYWKLLLRLLYPLHNNELRSFYMLMIKSAFKGKEKTVSFDIAVTSCSRFGFFSYSSWMGSHNSYDLSSCVLRQEKNYVMALFPIGEALTLVNDQHTLVAQKKGTETSTGCCYGFHADLDLMADVTAGTTDISMDEFSSVCKLLFGVFVLNLIADQVRDWSFFGLLLQWKWYPPPQATSEFHQAHNDKPVFHL